MERLIEDFKKARLALIQAINNFPIEKRKEALFGKWSLKDILAHISGWDIKTIICLRRFKKGKVPEWVGRVSKFNQESVKKRKDWTWPRVYKEFIEKGIGLTKEYQSVPEELWGKKIWSNKSFTPEKLLKIDIRHYSEHLAQIKRFIP